MSATVTTLRDRMLSALSAEIAPLERATAHHLGGDAETGRRKRRRNPGGGQCDCEDCQTLTSLRCSRACVLEGDDGGLDHWLTRPDLDSALIARLERAVGL